MKDTLRSIEASLAELRRRGAVVEVGPAAGPGACDEAERLLGFALPAHVRAFFETFGSIVIDDEWWFYAVGDAIGMAEEYAMEFRPAIEARGDADRPYYPTRFVVLADRGMHGNAASGTVYDADLSGLLATAGARWVDAESASTDDYLGVVATKLEYLLESRYVDLEAELDACAARPEVAVRADAFRVAHELARRMPEDRAWTVINKRLPTVAEARRARLLEERMPTVGLADLDLHTLLLAFDATLRNQHLSEHRANLEYLVPAAARLLERVPWNSRRLPVDGSRLFSALCKVAADGDLGALVDELLAAQWFLFVQDEDRGYGELERNLVLAASRRASIGPLLQRWTQAATDTAVAAEHAGRSIVFDLELRLRETVSVPEAASAELHAWTRSAPLRRALQIHGCHEALEHLDDEPSAR